MTMTTDFIICPGCGKRIERTGAAGPEFCPDCGADIAASTRDDSFPGEDDFDYERVDVIEFYEREDWE